MNLIPTFYCDYLRGEHVPSIDPDIEIDLPNAKHLVRRITQSDGSFIGFHVSERFTLQFIQKSGKLVGEVLDRRAAQVLSEAVIPLEAIDALISFIFQDANPTAALKRFGISYKSTSNNNADS